MAEPAFWLPLTAPSGRSPGGGTGYLEMPTIDIPCNCSCSWTVVRPGPGRQCRSRLSYRNAMCPRGPEHDRAIREARQR